MSPARRRRTRRGPIAITGLGAVSGYGAGTAALWRASPPGPRRSVRSRASSTRASAPNWRRKSAKRGGSRRPRGDRRSSLADRFALGAAARRSPRRGCRPGWTSSPAASTSAARPAACSNPRATSRALMGQPQRASGIGRLTAQQTCSPGESVGRALRRPRPGPDRSLGLRLGDARHGERARRAARRRDRHRARRRQRFALPAHLCRIQLAARRRPARPAGPFAPSARGCRSARAPRCWCSRPPPSARARGARILGWLRRRRRLLRCASHDRAGSARGGHRARRRSGARRRRPREPSDIDFVNVHGTGTPHNDAAEANMLRAVFGDRLPHLPLTSSKGAIGHYLGAAGAIEAVATMLCFLHGAVHPTPGEGAVDPAMGLDLVTVSPRARPRRALRAVDESRLRRHQRRDHPRLRSRHDRRASW